MCFDNHNASRRSIFSDGIKIFLSKNYFWERDKIYCVCREGISGRERIKWILMN